MQQKEIAVQTCSDCPSNTTLQWLFYKCTIAHGRDCNCSGLLAFRFLNGPFFSSAVSEAQRALFSFIYGLVVLPSSILRKSRALALEEAPVETQSTQSTIINIFTAWISTRHAERGVLYGMTYDNTDKISKPHVSVGLAQARPNNNIYYNTCSQLPWYNHVTNPYRYQCGVWCLH